MEVCNRGHEEIVFDGLVCPFCKILDENDRLIDEIAELKEKIEYLNWYKAGEICERRK